MKTIDITNPHDIILECLEQVGFKNKWLDKKINEVGDILSWRSNRNLSEVVDEIKLITINILWINTKS